MSSLDISLIATEAEREWCAQLMAGSEPWLTLGRDLETCRRLFRDPALEVYVGRVQEQLTAFLILELRGPWSGYLQRICVVGSGRGNGIGTQLLAFASRHQGRGGSIRLDGGKGVSPARWRDLRTGPGDGGAA